MRIKNNTELIEQLKYETIPIIVEGRKDAINLDKYNINSIKINGNLIEFCEKIKSKKVILLMDTDREGEKLTNQLRRIFNCIGVSCILKYWRAMKQLRITHVEGINLK